MKSLAYNVVVLPAEELAAKAIETSRKLSDKGVLFTLADGAFYPHVSIYMLQLKPDKLTEVEQSLDDIAKVTGVLSLAAYKYGQSKQFLDAEYQKPETLSELQTKVVTTLNPLRDGMRAQDAERMQEASGPALENFKRYGWNTIGELYRPHLTLTRFIGEHAISDLPLSDVTYFSGTFPKLGLFEMGDNGTCVRKIATFELER